MTITSSYKNICYKVVLSFWVDVWPVCYKRKTVTSLHSRETTQYINIMFWYVGNQDLIKALLKSDFKSSRGKHSNNECWSWELAQLHDYK